MSASTEVWQTRVDRGLARELEADAEVLGLSGRSEIVRFALDLLHSRAAEERMASQTRTFHAGEAPLPLGVRPSSRRPAPPTTAQ